MAATPGLGPHDEVLADALLLVLVELAVDAGALELVLLLLLLLLPQPARSIIPMTAAREALKRTRGTW